MSQETTTWLNENVLMGFVDDREKWINNGFAIKSGEQVKPWFNRGDYSNGYTGPVPIEAVEKLFGWTALTVPVHSYIPCDSIEAADMIGDGGQPMRKVTSEHHMALVRSDNGDFLNVVSDRYGDHQYSKWLVENVGAILDDDELAIDSAGLLMRGGVAWVSVSLPDTIETAAGFPVRPRLLAFTGHNGQYRTSYKRSLEAPLCDNSLAVEVRRDSKNAQQWSTKHTANSHLLIGDAREALGIMHRQAAEMVEFVEKLSEWEVTNRQFANLMERLQPVPERIVEEGKVKNNRAIGNAERKRGEITNLYLRDGRAAPWKGTALGVLQAFNTWDQQVREIKTERVERRMLNTIGDEVSKFDAMVLDTLADLAAVDLHELVTV